MVSTTAGQARADEAGHAVTGRQRDVAGHDLVGRACDRRQRCPADRPQERRRDAVDAGQDERHDHRAIDHEDAGEERHADHAHDEGQTQDRRRPDGRQRGRRVRARTRSMGRSG